MKKVQFIVEVQLIEDLGVGTAAAAKDQLEETLRNSGIEELVTAIKPYSCGDCDDGWFESGMLGSNPCDCPRGLQHADLMRASMRRL